MARDDGMVQMKAQGMFTRNSPTTGAILHGDDREQADKRAQFPLVSAADAQFLEDEGLAKPHSGSIDLSDDVVGMTIDERAGEFSQHYAEADASTVNGSTGLDTRQTTTFERPLEQISAAGGANREVLRAASAGGDVAAEEDAPAGRDGQGPSSKAASSSRASTKNK